MWPFRYEATPVPNPGSGISSYEARTLFRETRALMEREARAKYIDLTEADSDDEPLFRDPRDSLAISEQFEALEIRPREQSDRSRIFESPCANSQASSFRRSQPAGRFSPRFEVASAPQSRKRKESPRGDGVVENWLSIKRRLRPRTQVTYAEDAATRGAIEVDEAKLGNYLIESVETDVDESENSNDSDESDTEVWEVKRVVAEKRGPGVHEYLLDWVRSDEQNWIPARRCRCRDLISEFRSIPRVPADTHYLATLERSRLRRADNARRTGAARPQNLRARNPKTGRFEKRRVAPSSLRLDLEIPNSDAENDELDFDIRRPEPPTWRDQAARTPSKTPSLDHFSSSTNGSPASIRSKPHQSDLSPEYHPDPQDTVVWIRKDPVGNDHSPSPRERSNSVQRPMQTAKITWIRNTPGFEDEQSSFPRSDGTVVFTSTTSTKTKILRGPSNLPQAAPNSLAHNSMLPYPDVRLHGFTAINTQCSASISRETSRWTAVKLNPSPSPLAQPQAYSAVATKLRATEPASPNPSASVPPNINQPFSVTHHKPHPIAQSFSSHAKCSPGGFDPVISSAKSSVTGHAGVSYHAAAKFASMPPPPPRLSPQIVPATGMQGDANTKPADLFTSRSPLVATISHRGHAGSSASPKPGFYLRSPKPKAKRPLVSPKRASKIMPSSSLPSQTAAFSWSPPSSPERCTSNAGPKRISHATTKPPHLQQPTFNSSKDYSTGIMRMPEAVVQPSLPETVIDISDLLDLARAVASAPQSTSSIPFPRPICELSSPPETTPPNSQLMRPASPQNERQYAECREAASHVAEARNFPQLNIENVQHPPLSGQKEVPSYHSFKVRSSYQFGDGNGSRSITATLDTMHNSRSPIRREPLSNRPGQRKVMNDRFTQTIEDEIASKVGLHVASKKATEAVLLTASANAYRGPPTTQKPDQNNERSPSVSTKWFIDARKKEKEDALARAPKGVRPELNRDYGVWYPQGLWAAAKREEEETFTARFRELGLNYSRDTPIPSIEG